MTNNTLAHENGITNNYSDANDTREQLEADVRKCITSFQSTVMYPDSANKTTEIITTTVDTIFGWLDRQEAITVDECFVQSKTGADSLVLWENCRLQEKLDEMERTHIKLPVDADGLPIRPGDVLCYFQDGQKMYVYGVCEDGFFYTYEGEKTQLPLDSYIVSHVKQDTVESLLEEALDDAAMLDRGVGYWPSAADITNIVNDYAERIRKVCNG